MAQGCHIEQQRHRTVLLLHKARLDNTGLPDGSEISFDRFKVTHVIKYRPFTY